MNKLVRFVAGGLLLSGGVGIAAAGSRCEEFTGKLILAPTTCAAFQEIKRVERFFEDAVFLFEYDPNAPVCFAGTISGAQLGGKAVSVSSLSALTANRYSTHAPYAAPYPMPYPMPYPAVVPYPLSLLTAATVVTISSDEGHGKGKELGSLFLRDTGVFGYNQNGPYAVEQLIGVGGTKKFAQASASLEIEGYEFGHPVVAPKGAEIKGTICR